MATTQQIFKLLAEKGLRLNYWLHHEYFPEYQPFMEGYNYSQYVAFDGSPLTDSWSEDYRLRFEQGDKESIYEFCGFCWAAFRYDWVINQIENWQEQHTEVSRLKFNKLMECYWNRGRGHGMKGKRKLNETIKLIERDQEIFKALVKRILYDGRHASEVFLDFEVQNYRNSDLARESYKEIWERYSFWCKKFYQQSKVAGRKTSEEFLDFLDKFLYKVRKTNNMQ